MKKKLIELLDRKLTIGYVKRYLRSKGIATGEECGNSLEFRHYDLIWYLFCEDGRISMRCAFTLDDSTRMDAMMRAANTVNNERYVVKVLLDESVPQDENGNPIKGAPARRDITFSFESLCFTESAFDRVYEFAIYAMLDAMECHTNMYNKFLAEHNSQTAKVGFFADSEMQDTAPKATNEQGKRRIGFIQ